MPTFVERSIVLNCSLVPPSRRQTGGWGGWPGKAFLILHLERRPEPTTVQFPCDRKTRRVPQVRGGNLGLGVAFSSLKHPSEAAASPRQSNTPSCSTPDPSHDSPSRALPDCVHVIQFLPLLSRAIHIEIVKPRLPERPQRFTRCRKRQSQLPRAGSFPFAQLPCHA
jgi:hypothetical protein